MLLDVVATGKVLQKEIKTYNLSKLELYILHDSCFEIIKKLKRDYSFWQILSLVCPLKYHVTLFLPHQS